MSSESESCCPTGSHQVPVLSNDPEAKPRGSLLELGPEKTPCYYVSAAATGTITDNTTSDGVGIVVYTDVWGFQSRIRTICDYLAEHGPGFRVIAPDCFRGETKGDHGDDFVDWIRSTPYDPVVARDTRACVEHLRSEGATVFGTIGFCWGAWAIGRSSAGGFPWRAAVGLHPSFGIEKMAFGGDDVGLMKRVSCPLLLLPAKNDPDYTKPGSPEVEEFVKKQGGNSVLFPDMSHGWTTRGDMKDENVERDVNEAVRMTLEFLQTNLKA